jgi:hypothetical protein
MRIFSVSDQFDPSSLNLESNWIEKKGDSPKSTLGPKKPSARKPFLFVHPLQVIFPIILPDSKPRDPSLSVFTFLLIPLVCEYIISGEATYSFLMNSSSAVIAGSAH